MIDRTIREVELIIASMEIDRLDDLDIRWIVMEMNPHWFILISNYPTLGLLVKQKAEPLLDSKGFITDNRQKSGHV